MNGEFIKVDVDKCYVTDTNARPGEIGEIAALSASVKENGVLVPLFGIHHGDGKVEIVDGQRRLAAARAAGLDSVPVMVYREMPKAEELGIALNVLRKQLDQGQIAKASGHVLEKLGFKPGDVRTLALAKKSSAKLLTHEGIVASAAACGIGPDDFIRYGALSMLDAGWWARYAAGRLSLLTMSKIAALTDEQRAKLAEINEVHYISDTAVMDVTGVRVSASAIERKHALFANTKDLEELSDLFGETGGLTQDSAITFMARQSAVVDELAADLRKAGFTVEILTDMLPYSARFSDRRFELARKSLKAAISDAKGYDDKETSIYFRITRTGMVEMILRTKEKRTGTTAGSTKDADQKLLTVKQYDEAVLWLAQELLDRAVDMPDRVLAWAAGVARLEDQNALLGGGEGSPFSVGGAYVGFWKIRGRHEQEDLTTKAAKDVVLSVQRGGTAYLAVIAERLVRNLALGWAHSRQLMPTTLVLMAMLEIDPRASFRPSKEFLSGCSKAEIVRLLTKREIFGWLKTAGKAELVDKLHENLKESPCFPDVDGWIPEPDLCAEPEMFFSRVEAQLAEQQQRRAALEPGDEDGETVDEAAKPDVPATHRGDTPGAAADDDEGWDD